MIRSCKDRWNGDILLDPWSVVRALLERCIEDVLSVRLKYCSRCRKITVLHVIIESLVQCIACIRVCAMLFLLLVVVYVNSMCKTYSDAE